MKRCFQIISGVRNSYKVANFLHLRSLKNLMVEKILLNAITFHLIT